MFLNNLTTLMPVLLLHVHVSLECNYVDVRKVRSCKVRSVKVRLLWLMCVVYCKVTVEDKSMLNGILLPGLRSG